MQILREITKDFDANICHDYIVDGFKCVAYRKHGRKRWKTFSKPLMFSKTRRKFKTLREAIPSSLKKIAVKPEGKKVVGSKGDVYYVNDGKCTCKGFMFRGKCKHI
jgi:hypothetical protein